MTSSDRSLKIAEASYTEAVRGLSGQESSLESVRQRATANIAIAGVATSFLGGEAISSSTNLVLKFSFLISLVIFLLSIAASVYILISRKGWVFHQSSRGIRNNYIESNSELAIDGVLFTIAGHLEDSYRANQQKLDKLYSVMNLAFLLTVVHIISWILIITISTWSLSMSTQPQPDNRPTPAQNEPAAPPARPPEIPNPGIEQQRSIDPPKAPPINITPAREQ
jgi:hypothetical protein